MPIPKAASNLILSAFLPGILGGLLAFVASNIWFFYLGGYVLAGSPTRLLLPDFFSYLQIDVYVGAGCGYAGSITAPAIADLFRATPQQARLLPALYTLILATGVTLIVNVLLLLMSLL